MRYRVSSYRWTDGRGIQPPNLLFTPIQEGCKLVERPLINLSLAWSRCFACCSLSYTNRSFRMVVLRDLFYRRHKNNVPSLNLGQLWYVHAYTQQDAWSRRNKQFNAIGAVHMRVRYSLSYNDRIRHQERKWKRMSLTWRDMRGKVSGLLREPGTSTTRSEKSSLAANACIQKFFLDPARVPSEKNPRVIYVADLIPFIDWRDHHWRHSI